MINTIVDGVRLQDEGGGAALHGLPLLDVAVLLRLVVERDVRFRSTCALEQVGVLLGPEVLELQVVLDERQCRVCILNRAWLGVKPLSRLDAAENMGQEMW